MSETREEIAAVLETVARDGLPKPRDLDAAIDAIIAAAVPPGFVVVPRKATVAMCEAASRRKDKGALYPSIWAAMVKKGSKGNE